MLFSLQQQSSDTANNRVTGRPADWFCHPEGIRNAETYLQSRSKIKQWRGDKCTCKLCRPFVPNLGFVIASFTLIF